MIISNVSAANVRKDNGMATVKAGSSATRHSSKPKESAVTMNVPVTASSAVQANKSDPANVSERATPDQNETIDVELLVEEHKALLSLKILDDRMMDVVKAAKPIGDGFVLMTGDRTDLDELAGWVAGECSHKTKRRRDRLLNDACGAIEEALRWRARGLRVPSLLGQ